MTDFLSLPGNTVPMDHEVGPLGPGDTVPLDNNADDGGVVRSTSPEWRWRAGVAAEGAEQLREAAGIVEKIGYSNNFGNCVEGTELHSKVSALIDNWRSELRRSGNDLTRMAQQCVAADTELETSDSHNASVLET